MPVASSAEPDPTEQYEVTQISRNSTAITWLKIEAL
jgi:hypothetical protein